jgi:hypothetical protein
MSESDVIYVLVASECSMGEGCQTSLVVADLVEENLTKLLPICNSIAAKYKTATSLANEHMRAWQTSNVRPSPFLEERPALPRRLRNVADAVADWERKLKAYEAKRKAFMDASGAFNAAYNEERRRAFELHLTLTPEETALYPAIGHYYDCTFEVERVPTPERYAVSNLPSPLPGL